MQIKNEHNCLDTFIDVVNKMTDLVKDGKIEELNAIMKEEIGAGIFLKEGKIIGITDLSQPDFFSPFGLKNYPDPDLVGAISDIAIKAHKDCLRR